MLNLGILFKETEDRALRTFFWVYFSEDFKIFNSKTEDKIFNLIFTELKQYILKSQFEDFEANFSFDNVTKEDFNNSAITVL